MRQAGVSLIESLVALLLISIALLGVAGLQLLSLQDGRDARWRVEATSLANGALELIRTRPERAEAFEVSATQEGHAIAACPDSDPAICTNMTYWLARVDEALPHGSATVDVQETSGVEHVAISLRWRQQPPSDDNPLPTCGVEAASGGCVTLETRL